jgi:acyl-CoA thioesterase
MVNGHGICHGGFIFALADTNFAYACNSFNHYAVAAGVDINFIAPAHLGDTLTATATRAIRAGAAASTTSRSRTRTARLIAVFRGRSTRIKGNFSTKAKA